jgi:hypothetical protein
MEVRRYHHDADDGEGRFVKYFVRCQIIHFAFVLLLGVVALVRISVISELYFVMFLIGILLPIYPASKTEIEAGGVHHMWKKLWLLPGILAFFSNVFQATFQLFYYFGTKDFVALNQVASYFGFTPISTTNMIDLFVWDILVYSFAIFRLLYFRKYEKTRIQAEEVSVETPVVWAALPALLLSGTSSPSLLSAMFFLCFCGLLVRWGIFVHTERRQRPVLQQITFFFSGVSCFHVSASALVLIAMYGAL